MRKAFWLGLSLFVGWFVGMFLALSDPGVGQGWMLILAWSLTLMGAAVPAVVLKRKDNRERYRDKHEFGDRRVEGPWAHHQRTTRTRSRSIQRLGSGEAGQDLGEGPETPEGPSEDGGRLPAKKPVRRWRVCLD